MHTRNLARSCSTGWKLRDAAILGGNVLNPEIVVPRIGGNEIAQFLTVATNNKETDVYNVYIMMGISIFLPLKIKYYFSNCQKDMSKSKCFFEGAIYIYNYKTFTIFKMIKYE